MLWNVGPSATEKIGSNERYALMFELLWSGQVVFRFCHIPVLVSKDEEWASRRGE